MNVEITRETPILMKARVSVPWEKVEPHYKDALKTVAKSVQVPGFRKGKVPAALLKKRYKDYLISDVVEKLVPGQLDSVIKEKELNAVGQPRLEEVDLKDKQSFDFVAQIEVIPEIELGEWRGIEAERLNVKVSEEDVESELQHHLQHGAEKVPVTDRAIEDGDFVLTELTAIDVEEGEALTDDEGFEIAVNDEAHPFLREMVTGLRIGENKTAEYDAPEDDAMDAWQGKKVKVILEVMDIWRMSEPELNDDFAKAKGHDDLAAWRSEIEGRMHKSLEDQEENRLTSDIIEKVIKDYDFEVPPGLVSSEANMMVQQQIMPYAQYLQGQNRAETDNLIQSMMQASIPSATRKAKADILLDAIAKDLSLDMGDEEMNEELEKMLPETEFKTVEDLRADLEENDRMPVMKQMVLRQKAVKALVEASKITIVDELTPPESDQEVDLTPGEVIETEEAAVADTESGTAEESSETNEETEAPTEESETSKE